MATITPIKPHTRIDNETIDDYLPQIGVYGMGVYLALKRYLNQKTGQCNPSYKTIARKIGIDRGTVIRYVKKLTAFGLLSPTLRFKDDGSQSSIQYNFSPAPVSRSADRQDQDESKEGGGTEPLPLVAENHRGGGTEPPKQSSSLNKRERTISDVDLMPTERQKTCAHPAAEIVFLADHPTLSHHCDGLLDEHLTLLSCLPSDTKETTPAERVESERVGAA
jgi:hypothetical protein